MEKISERGLISRRLVTVHDDVDLTVHGTERAFGSQIVTQCELFVGSYLVVVRELVRMSVSRRWCCRDVNVEFGDRVVIDHVDAQSNVKSGLDTH